MNAADRKEFDLIHNKIDTIQKAVDEIKSRISKEVKLDVNNLPVDTFHNSFLQVQ